MKKVTTYLSLTILLSFVIFISGCGTSPKEQIVGTWKAIDVIAGIDSTSIKPEALETTINMYMSYSFEFYENNSMNVMASGSTFAGRWKYDKNEDLIKIRLDNSASKEFSPLGEIKDGQIININKTGLGDITVIYEKTEKE